MWDKIKKFAADAKAKASDLADKGLKAVPDLAKKAAVGIKGWDEFENARKANKRFVAVFGNRTDPQFQTILLKMGYYQTLAFISGAKLKSVELDDYTDFAKSLDVSVSPTVLYFKKEELAERHEGAADVGAFLSKLNTL